MPKIRHIDPTITSDVNLLYPNQSGTIARLSDITVTPTSITSLFYSRQTKTNIVINSGFWANAFNFGTVIANHAFRANFVFRCNKVTGFGAGQWQFRVQFGDTLDLGYPIYTVPSAPSGIYDWGTMQVDFLNPIASSLPILYLYASKTTGGGVTSAQARLTRLTYF